MDFDEVEEGYERPDCGDMDLMKTRLVSQQCATCVFRPGNPVMDAEGLKIYVEKMLAMGTFNPCHSTYSPLKDGYVNADQIKPAVCRGFYNRYKDESTALLLISDMFGFVTVPVPTERKG